MTNNIIEAVQQKLEYPPLQKVDPNLQEIREEYPPVITQKLAQGAIPAILTGFYSFLKTDEGIARLIDAPASQDWLDILYNDKKDEVVEKLAQYGLVSKKRVGVHMENIAEEAASQIKELSGSPLSKEKVRSYMSGQRHNILVYLPAALQLGDLLNDDSLDDRTNKMEGPVSSFMHKIENKFSGGEQ